MPSATSNNGFARELLLHGTVQGVGYRGHVCRLAAAHGVRGWVRNENAGLRLHLEGPPEAVAALVRDCLASPPTAARVAGWLEPPAAVEGWSDFQIRPSVAAAAPVVRLPTDLAMCEACRREVDDPADRRHGYAFTTCTQCGPRYSILRALPFDRGNTSMSVFPPCRSCTLEFATPSDRRFHAQALACAACGPGVTLEDLGDGLQCAGSSAVAAAVAALRAGRIVAIKGVGGFQLLARADDVEAIARLRHGKARPRKPFAVMAADVNMAEGLVTITPAERAVLTSSANPILLARRRSDAALAESVAPEVPTLGVFLPTTPLHHLLLKGVGIPVVATSGNRGEEPLLVDDGEVRERLTRCFDVLLTHDRPILQRIDDSVVRMMADGPVVFRLARGYAPLSLPALERFAQVPPVLAVGGQQKVAIAAWTGQQAILGPHVGDMASPAARHAFRDTVARFAELYQFSPGLVAHDAHPDFFTTRWACEQTKPTLAVQHHHAHVAAVLAEHGRLDGEVLALTWDGTGWGADATIWGGEILRATLRSYERVGCLRPFPLVGGEAAIRQPRRIALALLAQTLGPLAVVRDRLLLERLQYTAAEAEQLFAVARSPSFSPQTSSVGRLFDGVAALILGLGEVTYEGEAAIRLEALGDDTDDPAYPFPAVREGSLWHGDWRPMVHEVVQDLRRGRSCQTMVNRFHQGLAEWAATLALEFPGLPVVLAGGCFQNAELRRRVRRTLEARQRGVLASHLVPPGDGGLAAGQLAIALARCKSRGGPCA